MLENHRLLCGDSTVATDVERVLGTVKPLLMVTDPPYGVQYDPGWRNKTGASATKRTGKVLNDDRADWREAWSLFPGDVSYVWHGALHAATVAESLKAAGFNVRSQIIWAKERLVLSRRNYHWQHEPCRYAVKKTGKGHWAGDRKQTTLRQIANKDQDATTVCSFHENRVSPAPAGTNCFVGGRWNGDACDRPGSWLHHGHCLEVAGAVWQRSPWRPFRDRQPWCFAQTHPAARQGMFTCPRGSKRTSEFCLSLMNRCLLDTGAGAAR